MIDNSHIFHTSFNLVVRRAECRILFLFFPQEYVFWSYKGGGGGGGASLITGI